MPQHGAGGSVAQALERAITQLAHALAGDAEHLPDFVERVLTVRFESEIEAQNLGIACRKCQKRAIELQRAELIEDLILRARELVNGEALDERAIGVLADRCIETHFGGVERR